MIKDLYKYQYNTEDLYLTSVNESNVQAELVPGIQVNKKIKYNQELFIKAIQYGMIVLITYRGDKDEWKGGRERTICPLNMGRNKNTGNILIRGWHLDGYSVSRRNNIKKEWRLFKANNVLSMTFTGDFVRLAPSGYKMNDRVMTEITYAKADFNQIRNNQNKLVQQGKLQDVENTQMSNQNSSITTIEVSNMNDNLDLRNIWSNSNFDKKNTNIKATFLKSVIGNDYICIFGALGTPGRTIRLYDGKTLMGTYMTLKTIPEINNSNVVYNQLNNLKNVNGKTDFKLYKFVKKK